MRAEVVLDLDKVEALEITYITKETYTVIPFKDSNKRLFYIKQGNMSEEELNRLKSPFIGRVVGYSSLGDWNVNGKSIDLKNLLKGVGLKNSENTLLLSVDETLFQSLWLLLLSPMLILVFIYLFNLMAK